MNERTKDSETSSVWLHFPFLIPIFFPLLSFGYLFSPLATEFRRETERNAIKCHTIFSDIIERLCHFFIVLNFSIRIFSDASRASSLRRRCTFSHSSRKMPKKSARNRLVDCISKTKGALRSSGTFPCSHSASLTNCRAIACTNASQVLSNGRKLCQTGASATDCSARFFCLLSAEQSFDFIVESNLNICIRMPRCSLINL